MELRHLRYFVAVAENGGFARTARMLHISQSAISEQIRDLEDELGVPLFHRQNRRIRMTSHGEIFLEEAQAILTAAERAVVKVKKSLLGEFGTLTIGFCIGGTGDFFPRLIKEFRNRFEGIQVSLVEMAPALQHEALQTGSLDIGFTRPLQPASAIHLRTEHFRTERLCAVLPRSHRLARRHTIYILELAKERFILNDRNYSPVVFDKVISLCAEAGFSPHINATATASPGVVALVEAGEGVAVLPHGASKLSSKDLAFVPLAEETAQVDLVLAWSPKHATPAMDSFLDLARKTAKKQGKHRITSS